MWNIFKKVEWREETLPLMKRQAGGLQVLLRNFPYRQEKSGDRRTYLNPDFGPNLMDDLAYRELADFAAIQSALAEGRQLQIDMNVSQRDFVIEIQGNPPRRAKQFYSDVADALIDAFDKNGIKP